jgi:endo-1,4-beta-xylanase
VNPGFVAVTSISNVPNSTDAGIPLTLTGTVSPSNATNRTIAWAINNSGGTGAYISNGNILNTTAAGTVTVTATIANGASLTTPYTQNFQITVNPAFVAVSGISDVPNSTYAGMPLTLAGAVSPSNATNRTITWTVSNAGGTGASISGGNILNTTGAGTVTVTATIASGASETTPYTQNFQITVTLAFVAVTDISGVPRSMTRGVQLFLTGTVSPSNATNQTITWTVSNAGGTGASISGGNILNATGTGTVTVMATIVTGQSLTANYTQTFSITVNAGFVAVTGISNVPGSTVAGIPLPLTGTVSPSNATDQTITWLINTAGGTGAYISNGNILNTSASGTVSVAAIIANGLSETTPYMRDFTITVNPFIPVTNISGVPTLATMGTPLILSSTVSPSNATNQIITWSVKNAGGIGASIDGNVLNTTGVGTVTMITVAATIVNGTSVTAPYTQDFNITVNPGFVAVTGISGIPSSAIVNVPLALNGTVSPYNATNQTITWSVSDAGSTRGAITNGNILTATATGSVTVRAIITNGASPTGMYIQNFTIIIVAPRSITLTIDDLSILDQGNAVFANVPPIILSKSARESQVINADGFDNPVWHVGNIKLGSGNTVTLNAESFNTGTHTLSLTFTKDGAVWLASLPFTVTE